MIKLKDGINPEVLRKYGFKPGEAFFFKERRFDYSTKEAEDWFKFEMDPEEPDKILYADSDYDFAMVEMCFCKRYDNNSYILYIDCAPSCTYHIGGSELAIIENTLFDLITDGIVEKVNKND